jgi:Protein of unknown function (DUF3175)
MKPFQAYKELRMSKYIKESEDVVLEGPLWDKMKQWGANITTWLGDYKRAFANILRMPVSDVVKTAAKKIDAVVNIDKNASLKNQLKNSKEYLDYLSSNVGAFLQGIQDKPEEKQAAKEFMVSSGAKAFGDFWKELPEHFKTGVESMPAFKDAGLKVTDDPMTASGKIVNMFATFIDHPEKAQAFFKAVGSEVEPEAPKANLPMENKMKTFQAYKELRMSKYIEEKTNVLSKVKTKWSPKEGFFNQSAEKIANGLKANSSSLAQAMSRLNFYVNRGGSKIKSTAKARLNLAKIKLHKMYQKKD